MIGFGAALIGSRWFMYALGLLAFAGAYEGWKYHQQHIGRDKIVAKIEQKAKADDKLAETVREKTPSPRGPDDPNRVR